MALGPGGGRGGPPGCLLVFSAVGASPPSPGPGLIHSRKRPAQETDVQAAGKPTVTAHGNQPRPPFIKTQRLQRPRQEGKTSVEDKDDDEQIEQLTGEETEITIIITIDPI